MRTRRLESICRSVLLTSLLGSILIGCSGEEERRSDVSIEVNREAGEADTAGSVGSADAADTTADRTPNLDEVPPLPTGYELLSDANGDLDQDGRPERVLVVETDRTGEFGRERELMVFRWSNGAWDLWKNASGPVLASQAGGAFGDPYSEGLSIERGTIVLHHYGGSNIRWNYIHRYRYQDGDFHLIGATSGYGRPCTEWSELDYNLSTGRAIFTHTLDDCEEEGGDTPPQDKVEFTRKPTSLPVMDGFVPGETALQIPEGEEMYY